MSGRSGWEVEQPENIYLKKLTRPWRCTDPHSRGTAIAFGPRTGPTTTTTTMTTTTVTTDTRDPRLENTKQRQQQKQQQISFEDTVGIRKRFSNMGFELSSDGQPKRLIVHEDISTCGVYITGFTLRRPGNSNKSSNSNSNRNEIIPRKLTSPGLIHLITPILARTNVQDLAVNCSVFYSDTQSAFYRPYVKTTGKFTKSVLCVYNEGWFGLITLLPHARSSLLAVQAALNNFVWDDTVIQARCCPLGKFCTSDIG